MLTETPGANEVKGRATGYWHVDGNQRSAVLDSPQCEFTAGLTLPKPIRGGNGLLRLAVHLALVTESARACSYYSVN